LARSLRSLPDERRRVVHSRLLSRRMEPVALARTLDSLRHALWALRELAVLALAAAQEHTAADSAQRMFEAQPKQASPAESMVDSARRVVLRVRRKSAAA